MNKDSFKKVAMLGLGFSFASTQLLGCGVEDSADADPMAEFDEHMSALSSANVTCAPTNAAKARAVVLYIHPGAWYYPPAPGPEREICELLKNNNYYAVSLHYPLMNYPAGLDYVRKAASGFKSFGWKVYAVGESAGATYALQLLNDRLVDGAVANAPVTALDAWQSDNFWCDRKLCGGANVRRIWSPLNGWVGASRVIAPYLIMASPQDTVVSNAHSIYYYYSTTGVADRQYRHLTGPHLGDCNWRSYMISWLDSHAPRR
jgi:hypothetical protein